MVKIFPKINLSEIYGAGGSKWDCDESYREKSLKELLKCLKIEENPFTFRNALFATIQLYFDSLVDSANSQKASEHVRLWQNQKHTLDQLISAGRLFVNQFYSGNFNANEVRQKIPDYDEILRYYDRKCYPRERHLEYHLLQTQIFARRLPRIIGSSPNTIVCIASGGFEPACISMETFGVDNILAVKLSSFSLGEREPKLPTMAPLDYVETAVRNKNILIVDDWINSATAFNGVLGLLKEYRPQSLAFSAVIGTSKSFSREYKQLANRYPVTIKVI